MQRTSFRGWVSAFLPDVRFLDELDRAVDNHIISRMNRAFDGLLADFDMATPQAVDEGFCCCLADGLTRIRQPTFGAVHVVPQSLSIRAVTSRPSA